MCTKSQKDWQNHKKTGAPVYRRTTWAHCSVLTASPSSCPNWRASTASSLSTSLVPATKGFHHHRQKSDALPLARFSSMSSSGGCARYSGCLAGVDHSHVQRRILASHLVWKQRISCAAVLPRDEESDLPHRPKISCHCSVMEVVPQVVVAENALPA